MEAYMHGTESFLNKNIHPIELLVPKGHYNMIDRYLRISMFNMDISILNINYHLNNSRLGMINIILLICNFSMETNIKNICFHLDKSHHYIYKLYHLINYYYQNRLGKCYQRYKLDMEINILNIITIIYSSRSYNCRCFHLECYEDQYNLGKC